MVKTGLIIHMAIDIIIKLDLIKLNIKSCFLSNSKISIINQYDSYFNIYYDCHQILTGELAYQKGLNDPENYIDHILEYSDIQNWNKFIPNLNKNINVQIVLEDIFRKLFIDFKQKLTSTVNRIVIILPFLYSDQVQKKLLFKIADNLQLKQVHILNEIQALGYCYHLHNTKFLNKNILIFDLRENYLKLFILRSNYHQYDVNQIQLNIMSLIRNNILSGKNLLNTQKLSIQDLITSCHEVLQDLIQNAFLDTKDIHFILQIGLSCQFPFIFDFFKNQFSAEIIQSKYQQKIDSILIGVTYYLYGNLHDFKEIKTYLKIPTTLKKEEYLGIDFGSSTCYVSYWNAKRKSPELLSTILKNSDEKIDLCLYFDSNQKVILGETGYRKANKYPQNLIVDIQDHLLNYTWNQFIPKLNKSIANSDVIRALFKYIIDNRNNQGSIIKKMLVAVPSFIDDYQKNLIVDVIEKLGVKSVKIIDDLISLCIYYNLYNKKNNNKFYIVLDGAGTYSKLNIIQINIDKNLFEIKIMYQYYNHNYSGKIIDEHFYKKIQEHQPKQFLTLRKNQYYDFIKEIRNTKEHLSDTDHYESHLEITREQFNQWIEELNIKNEYISWIETALSQTQINTEDIESIILNGGNTQLSIIKEAIVEYFGAEKLLKSQNVLKEVALGTAKYYDLRHLYNIKLSYYK